LGRKSKFSIKNKLLLYKCIIKPIWYTAVGLHKTIKHKNNSETPIQCLKLSSQRTLVCLQIPFVLEEIHRLSAICHQSTLGHNNRLVAEISSPPYVIRRFRIQWPSDLPQPADEEN
jgi:hypothetical protein